MLQPILGICKWLDVVPWCSALTAKPPTNVESWNSFLAFEISFGASTLVFTALLPKQNTPNKIIWDFVLFVKKYVHIKIKKTLERFYEGRKSKALAVCALDVRSILTPAHNVKWINNTCRLLNISSVNAWCSPVIKTLCKNGCV